MQDTQTAYVDRDWLAHLKEYLMPQDRWVNDKMGIVLYTPAGTCIVFTDEANRPFVEPAPPVGEFDYEEGPDDE